MSDHLPAVAVMTAPVVEIELDEPQLTPLASSSQQLHLSQPDWNDQKTVPELEQELEQIKLREQQLLKEKAAWKAQIDQHKFMYENALADKEALSDQYSRQLAERDYNQAQIQQELDSCKLQLHRSSTSMNLDEDEMELLQSEVRVLKSEKIVLNKQRDMFASELNSLLAKYNRQLSLDAEKENTIIHLQQEITDKSKTIAALQVQLGSMANERDNSELKLLKRQVEEMNARLERSEKAKAEGVQIVQQQVAQTQKTKEKVNQMMDVVSTSIAQASAQVAASQAATITTSSKLASANTAANKKRKEREEMNAPITAATSGVVATKKAAASSFEDAAPKRKRYSSDPIDMALMKLEEAEEEKKQDAEWKEKKGKIATKWNVQAKEQKKPAEVKAASKKAPTTTTATTAAASSSSLTLQSLKALDTLSLSPIAATEAMLDAAASELNTSLNDSTTSIDSVTGQPRRKLFPTKRTQALSKKDKENFDLMPSPIVIRFDKPASYAAKAAAGVEKAAAAFVPANIAPRAPLGNISSSNHNSSSALSNPLHQKPLPPAALAAPQRMVNMPPAAAPSAAGTRNLFMHFLGGAMKVPKIKV